MMEVDITPEEENILCEMLEGCISDLREEILDTDRADYKEMLRQRRLILLKIYDALVKAVPAEAIA